MLKEIGMISSALLGVGEKKIEFLNINKGMFDFPTNSLIADKPSEDVKVEKPEKMVIPKHHD